MAGCPQSVVAFRPGSRFASFYVNDQGAAEWEANCNYPLTTLEPFAHSLADLLMLARG